MAKETLEKVNQQTGLGSILISVYKYLRDNSILKGVFKNPLIVERKRREASLFYEVLLNDSAGNVNTPFFSYRNISTSKEVRLVTFNAAVKSNKPVSFDIYKNPTILDTPAWSAFDDSTVIEKDTSAIAYTGGKKVGGVTVPEMGGVYVSQEDVPLFFSCMPGDIITIVLTVDQPSFVEMRLRLEEV